jgi:hypothetical protein
LVHPAPDLVNLPPGMGDVIIQAVNQAMGH